MLFLILRVAFLVALGWLGQDGLAPEPWHVPADAAAREMMLYGSVVALVLLIVPAELWAELVAARLALFFALVGRLGYVLYRGWQESRRYYY